jgi:hypothetical protein
MKTPSADASSPKPSKASNERSQPPLPPAHKFGEPKIPKSDRPGIRDRLLGQGGRNDCWLLNCTFREVSYLKL